MASEREKTIEPDEFITAPDTTVEPLQAGAVDSKREEITHLLRTAVQFAKKAREQEAPSAEVHAFGAGWGKRYFPESCF